jgi:hypothetical protein
MLSILNAFSLYCFWIFSYLSVFEEFMTMKMKRVYVAKYFGLDFAFPFSIFLNSEIYDPFLNIYFQKPFNLLKEKL